MYRYPAESRMYLKKEAIKKIIFISDHYRSRQERNIKILFGLLSPIFMESGISVEMLPDVVQYLDTERWRRGLDGIGVSALSDYCLDDAAVIGFEINPLDITYLNDHDTPWINIETHPIRFLEDLHFSVTASFSFDFDVISCGEKQIQLAANIQKLEYLERSKDLEDNILVILGQTPADKSIYFDGKFKSLLDYTDKLDALCNEHKNVLYRPHPIETDARVDAEIIKRYNASIKNGMNFYELVSAKQVKTVCAISSSSLHEAKYFHKQSIFLEERIKIFSKPISLKSLLECNTLWFDGLLSIDSREFKKEKFEPAANLCRDFYGYWSYETKMTRAADLASRALIKASLAEAEASRIMDSASWKITEPLRKLRILLGRIGS